MSRLPYRAEIDGLRAIAVLSVVLYHADFGLRSGQVGVDVFFVISGYLITCLLSREWRDSGRIDLAAFYARRVRRILPAMLAVVAAVSIASVVLLSPYGEAAAALNSAAASLLFAGNFYFQAHTGGYFDPGVERLPLLHLWSLGVEEQFYLMWPLGLALLLPRSAARTCIAAAALASLLCAEVQILRASNAAFYLIPGRFWELAVGGLLALDRHRAAGAAPGRAAAGLLLVVASTLLPLAHFPGLGAVPAVAGAALLLHALHRAQDIGPAGTVLRSAPMVFIGRISYSLYLWHWPLLALARATQAGALTPMTRLALCAAAVALAWASYRWIEQPLRRPSPRISHRAVVGAALALSLALACDAVVAGGWVTRPPPATDLASRTAADMPFNRVRCSFRGADAVAEPPRPDCLSDAHQPLRVAIWGDSHAMAWQPLAWNLAQARQASAMGYTRDACPPLLDYDNGKPALEAQRCVAFNRLVADRISGLGLDTLVMAARWPPHADARFDAALQATLARIAPRVGKLMLLGPTPVLPDSVPHCMATHNLAACDLSHADFDAAASAARTVLQRAAREYPNVEYLEPAGFFCDGSTCPAMRDGYGLYWDSNHVSVTAARRFAEAYSGQAPVTSNP